MRNYLLLDADDTLWENNIYFEQAIHDFITFLNHSTLSADEVRRVLNEAERVMGYGSVNFAKSLVATYRRVAESDVREEEIQRVRQFGERILHQPLQLIDGVQETLDYLVRQYELVLLTKGAVDEQTLKVERSGIERYFSRVMIVAEKNAATYREIVEQLQIDPTQTWMIGNSPRSDINPALASGLNAVYIPHPHTWHMEHEEVQNAGTGQLLQVQRFSDLRAHF